MLLEITYICSDPKNIWGTWGMGYSNAAEFTSVKIQMHSLVCGG